MRKSKARQRNDALPPARVGVNYRVPGLPCSRPVSLKTRCPSAAPTVKAGRSTNYGRKDEREPLDTGLRGASGGGLRSRGTFERSGTKFLPPDFEAERSAIFANKGAETATQLDRSRVGRCLAMRCKFRWSLRHHIYAPERDRPRSRVSAAFRLVTLFADIALDFAADEAVAQYRIDNVTPCVCRDRAAEERAAEDRATIDGGWRKE